jgi:hypothetical protein
MDRFAVCDLIDSFLSSLCSAKTNPNLSSFFDPFGFSPLIRRWESVARELCLYGSIPTTFAPASSLVESSSSVLHRVICGIEERLKEPCREIDGFAAQTTSECRDGAQSFHISEHILQRLRNPLPAYPLDVEGVVKNCWNCAGRRLNRLFGDGRRLFRTCDRIKEDEPLFKAAWAISAAWMPLEDCFHDENHQNRRDRPPITEKGAPSPPEDQSQAGAELGLDKAEEGESGTEGEGMMVPDSFLMSIIGGPALFDASESIISDQVEGSVAPQRLSRPPPTAASRQSVSKAEAAATGPAAVPGPPPDANPAAGAPRPGRRTAGPASDIAPPTAAPPLRVPVSPGAGEVLRGVTISRVELPPPARPARKRLVPSPFPKGAA